MKMKNNIDFEKRLIAYRRDFHKHAEIRWTEFRTASIVAEKLIELGIDIKLGVDIIKKSNRFTYPNDETIQKEINRAISQGGNPLLISKMDGCPGVVGIIETGADGPVTALRFDIDALSINESDDSNHPPVIYNYRSVNSDRCHSCGHDAHTAIGLGVAEWLMSIKGTLKGKIKLIFQPAEEGGGGAESMVDSGILDDVTYFFAGHMGLIKPNGQLLGSRGIICGTKDFLDNRRFCVNFNGKAAHPCSDSQNGKNALLAACTSALSIHGITPHSEGLLRVNVGILNAGKSRNIIAPNAYMEVETRGSNDTVANYGQDKMEAAIKGAALIHDVSCEIRNVGSTPSAESDDAAIELVIECAKDIEWFNDLYKIGSVGGTDDASDMIRKVQRNGGIGTYIGLGSDFTTGLHDSSFDMDESALLPSVELFVKLVQKIQQK